MVSSTRKPLNNSAWLEGYQGGPMGTEGGPPIRKEMGFSIRSASGIIPPGSIEAPCHFSDPKFSQLSAIHKRGV